MTVTAPDRTVWWDAATVTAAALAELRLTAGDVDADRIAALVDPAGQRINQYVDRDPADAWTTATVPVEVSGPAHVRVVVNLYNQATPPNQLIDGINFPVGSRDPLEGARQLLAPHRRRWGIG